MKNFFFEKKKLFTSLIKAAFFWWMAFVLPVWCVQNLDVNDFFKKSQAIGVDAGSLFYTETKEFDEAFEYFKSRPLK
jgi:hypothetical protein